ncbi:MAG TPA: hypothetical protein VFU08_04010 [Candidatus Udaeobacter sp.]|jgi:hypothetical protein|nr:hypothetical protein [Candidatus Udaeobacter sp.]
MKELESYLNDHLAGSVGALELLARWAQLYKDKPLGAFFTQLKAEIQADQATLRDLMRVLGVEESKVRRVGAWAVEKVGRARFMIAGDETDSLGLVLALEGLVMGIVGKKLLWRALAAANLSKVGAFDFKELERRAEQQFERTEAERIRAARRAIGSTTGLD